MKKTLIAGCILTLLVSTGCTEQEMPQTEVAVTLDYSFVESGSMTRAGSEVYTDFYEKYVKTKVLTPKTFTLTFNDKETGNSIAYVKGEWDKNHSFKLPTGEYEVIGTSHPISNNAKYNTRDSLYLSFNETVKITPQTSSITLTAQYDSYLLMFDASDKKSVDHVYDTPSYALDTTYELKALDNIYYGFFHRLYGEKYDKIEIEREVGTTTIYIHKLLFEKGKYYYFNDLSNSFDIPQMSAGN